MAEITQLALPAVIAAGRPRRVRFGCSAWCSQCQSRGMLCGCRWPCTGARVLVLLFLNPSKRCGTRDTGGCLQAHGRTEFIPQAKNELGYKPTRTQSRIHREKVVHARLKCLLVLRNRAGLLELNKLGHLPVELVSTTAAMNESQRSKRC